ncbi:hypothetical protein DFH11DRAFT_1878210 [Phellopilus nigrolimitatus]|nr:hypothetical protein DFH11DRAFT_1878210 [Phellopilus nigrolimitatus]
MAIQSRTTSSAPSGSATAASGATAAAFPPIENGGPAPVIPAFLLTGVLVILLVALVWWRRVAQGRAAAAAAAARNHMTMGVFIRSGMGAPEEREGRAPRTPELGTAPRLWDVHLAGGGAPGARWRDVHPLCAALVATMPPPRPRAAGPGDNRLRDSDGGGSRAHGRCGALGARLRAREVPGPPPPPPPHGEKGARGGRLRVAVVVALPTPAPERGAGAFGLDVMLGVAEKALRAGQQPAASASARVSHGRLPAVTHSRAPQTVPLAAMSTPSRPLALAPRATSTQTPASGSSNSLLFGFGFLAIFVAFVGGALAWQRFSGARRRARLHARRERRRAAAAQRPRLWDVYVRGAGSGGGSARGCWSDMKPLAAQIQPPDAPEVAAPATPSAPLPRPHPVHSPREPQWEGRVRVSVLVCMPAPPSATPRSASVHPVGDDPDVDADPPTSEGRPLHYALGIAEVRLADPHTRSAVHPSHVPAS